MLSGCFLGHNTCPAADLPVSLLFWNLPSTHPLVLCPCHLAPWVPHPAPQSCGAGVQVGMGSLPLFVLQDQVWVVFDQRSFERATCSSERTCFKGLRNICCWRVAVILVEGIYRTGCAVWPSGWAAERPGCTLWEVCGVSGLELGAGGQRTPCSFPRSPAFLAAAQVLQTQVGLAALGPGVDAAVGPALHPFLPHPGQGLLL